MSYQEFLSFERRGAVGIVRLARPEKLNTISAPFYEAMIELQQTEIVGDHDLRAIALLADGRHFSAGIDLNYAKAVIGKPGRSLYGVYHWQQAYRFWSECNLPVVVGIQGACMGTAIELITACDIRIAADNAKFSLREVDVGISTDLGGTTRLTLDAEEPTVKPGHLCYIRLRYTDENGITKPLARGSIQVQVRGGTLVGLGSACPFNKHSYLDSETDTYYGEALAIVRMGDGEAMTIAASDGEYSAELTVPAQA